jgi:hypothetical protein
LAVIQLAVIQLAVIQLAVIHFAMTGLMARRLTCENTLSWREPFIDRPVWVEATGERAVTRAEFPLTTREFSAAPVSSVTNP